MMCEDDKHINLNLEQIDSPNNPEKCPNNQKDLDLEINHPYFNIIYDNLLLFSNSI